jgi:hypothetical protein
LKKKIFDQKIELLAHSENFKIAKNYILINQPLLVKNMRILNLNRKKNINLLRDTQKIPTMGRFIKKRSTVFFKMVFFFHMGEVPNRFQQEEERCYFKQGRETVKAIFRSVPTVYNENAFTVSRP